MPTRGPRKRDMEAQRSGLGGKAVVTMGLMQPWSLVVRFHNFRDFDVKSTRVFNVLVVFSGPILVFGVVVLFWFTLWFSPCRLYGLGLCLELDRVLNLGLGLRSGSCRLSLASFCFVWSCPVLS